MNVATSTGSSALFVSSTGSTGQVGIGTASPDRPLTVSNGVFDGVVCRLVAGYSSNPGVGPSIDFSLGNLPTYSGASIKSLNSYGDAGGQSAHLAFYTANWNGTSGSLQERMRILAGGNVGIGTTSPGTTLQVYATGTTTPLNVVTASNTAYAFIATANQGIGTGVGATQPQMQFYHTTGGNGIYLNFFGYRQTAGTNWTGIAQRIQHTVDVTNKGYIDFNPGNATDGLAFGSGSTEAMRITSAGNVGIGTTNPGSALHTAISSATATTIATFENYNTTTTTAKSFKLQFYGNGAGGQKDLGGITIVPTDGNFGYNDMAFSIRGPFGASSAEAVAEVMRFSRSGTTPCVGIGTTSPGYILHVNTTATTGQNIASFFSPSLASGGQSLSILLGTGQALGQTGVITYLNYGTNSTNVMQFSMYGVSGSAININSTGVGIGTTSPGALLHVYGTYSYWGAYQSENTSRQNGTVLQGASWNAVNGANTTYYGPNFTIYAGVNAGSALWNLSGRPTHYGGDLILTGGDLNDTGNNGTGPVNANGGSVYIQGGIAYCGGGFAAYPYVAGDIVFQTGATNSGNTDQTRYERLRIKGGSGNVGIGTTNPNASLHVYRASGVSNFNVQTGDTTSFSQIGCFNAAGAFCGIFFNGSGRSADGGVNTGTIRNDGGDFRVQNSGGAGVYLIGGNVGIGTASPGATLEVNGAATFGNPWWIITGSGGNATYTAGQVWGSSTVNGTYYGSTVNTGGGASSSQWNGSTGIFTFPQKGVYSITICMFINATVSGRWAVLRVGSSVSGSSDQYMDFDPTNYAGNNQRNFKLDRYFNANDTFYCQTEGGSITLYWAAVHTQYFINKIG